MPRSLLLTPPRLEDLCTSAYLVHLFDEVNLIQQLQVFEGRSAVMTRYGLKPDTLQQMLEHQLSHSLKGTLHDLVRQKMMDALILNLHLLTEEVVVRPMELTVPNENPLATDALDSSQQPARLPLRLTASAVCRAGVGLTRPPEEPHLSTVGNLLTVNTVSPPSAIQSRLEGGGVALKTEEVLCDKSPILRLFELLLHKNMRVLDLSKNKLWTDNEALSHVARLLWKVIGERCDHLERFIVPKELSYSSTMNRLLRKGQNLTHLTLKRNVPTNMFLSVIGNNCPNLKELDIAGADIVTDFGIICLLFADPEQIFLECWHREKTVGSARRSQRAFPHPHFDKPIPDPADADQQSGSAGAAAAGSGVQFLHLRRSFYDVTMDKSFSWEALPICNSLEKLRLENTKVKGDGASVVLKQCPKLFSLGYLVFAAAGLKQVFGYEQRNDTKFVEIFYRGPSDQKLQTIGYCCHQLQTMFLGSNSQRRMNAAVFEKWPYLQYLTLENIIVDDVNQCLQLIGRQFKGLKIQCAQFDFTEVVLNCPNLETLIIQKENPISSMKDPRINTKQSGRFLTKLQHVEITCGYFPTSCLNFLMRHGSALRSVKILAAPGLSAEDITLWHGCLPELETFILFRAGADVTKEAVEAIFEVCPKLRVLGDLAGFEAINKSDATLKKLAAKVKEENWDLRLLQSSSNSADDKEFTKLLSLHWFYLTQARPPQKIMA